MGNFKKYFYFFKIFLNCILKSAFFSAQNLHIKGALWVILEKYLKFWQIIPI